ncbi:hypothetical protein QAD02_001679, partial [Eretmocerus hayati]
SSSSCQSSCDCVIPEPEYIPKTCAEQWAYYGTCKSRSKPLRLRHFELPSQEEHQHFSLDGVGASDDVPKWGDFLNMVGRVLAERYQRLGSSGSCCNDVCVYPTKQETKRIMEIDHFDDLQRFQHIKHAGFSLFCRNLMRWSNCTTKRWSCITSFPHVVIHLPSMSYPCHLRCTAHENFEALQNVQIGRIGWLVNPNAQVLYVCPGKSDFETKHFIRKFVDLARPDVCQSRLWIIDNSEKCSEDDHVEDEYRSGCESLFYTPKIYRRVRHLTAGRQSFIIPGVQCEMDVLVACELRTSIVGPCLKFQRRLLDKHYVMKLLADSNIQHPPFAGVRDFSELCERLAEMMSQRWLCKWLVKVNCGFCGNQSALICLDRCCSCLSKDALIQYLDVFLPQNLQVTKGAYENAKEFLAELEHHGGVVMAVAPGDCRTVSLGCFIEHDTARAYLRSAADVLRTNDGPDLGYVIPQTTLPGSILQELTRALGDALLDEQYVGFFGADVVVFEQAGELNYWVVDIDPYYTDLLSFDDWKRFCLDTPHSDSFSGIPTSSECEEKNRRISIQDQHDRYVVCSGKLHIEGLSNCVHGDFLLNLFKKHNIAYNSKAKTGCMICPLDSARKTFLLFSFCRGKDLALQLFMKALKILRFAAIDKREVGCSNKTNIVELIRDVEAMYGIHVGDPKESKKTCL